MSSIRRIKIFRNGRNQALRIPREFQLNTNEVTIRKEGIRLIIEPVEKVGLLATLATLPTLVEDFPDVSIGLAPVKDYDL
jgi:antitoxin VapB